MQKPKYRRTADGQIYRVDSLTNLTANLGTSRDKAFGATYSATMVSDDVLAAAYRTTWLARKIVDIPAMDATRKWRDWQADADAIEVIEREEKRLGLRGKVKQAKISARLFGYAAILIGTGDADLAQPLRPDAVAKGGLKYLAVLHKRQLSSYENNYDPASEFFGKPAMWRLNPGSTAGTDVHASRLAIFYGNGVVDDAYGGIAVGGADSVLLSAFDAVRNMDATTANVASLVYEAKVDTVGIPDFMQRLGDPGYENQMLKRWSLAETGKGINGTLMHDKDEVLGQKTASFSGLPDVIDRMMMMASGAADIPMTRLMGQAPAGLSSTGESDMRNYYDRVSAMQELEFTPAMYRLDECLIRSGLGNRPEEIYYRWGSLWQISDKERADIGKVQADMIKVLRDTGLYPDEALSEASVNMLTEGGSMPGLQGAVDDYFSASEGDDE